MENAFINKVREVLSYQLDVDVAEITPQTELRDLNADSLGIVEVIMGLEEAFEISIGDEEADTFLRTGTPTVAGLAERIAGRVL